MRLVGGDYDREESEATPAASTRYLAAYVTVSYCDYATRRYVYSDRTVGLDYTTSFADYMASELSRSLQVFGLASVGAGAICSFVCPARTDRANGTLYLPPGKRAG